jgi:hypothetical protein
VQPNEALTRKCESAQSCFGEIRMVIPNEGGRHALLGFVAQLLGVSGLKARGLSVASVGQASELDRTILSFASAEYRHEHIGQDMTIRHFTPSGENGCVLIQFKYSLDASNNPLVPSDIWDIIGALSDSEDFAREDGAISVDYALVTNRQLGPWLAEASRHLGDDVYRLGPSKHFVPPQEMQGVYDSLVVVRRSLNEWEGYLTDFAHLYGALPIEIDKGVDQIVGRLARGTVSDSIPQAFEQADLIKAFTGQPCARPLSTSAVAEITTERVNQFATLLSLRQDHYSRRQVLEELADAARQVPIVVLTGQGGCGKTVTMWQWALTLVSTAAEGGAYTEISLAEDIPAAWISDTIYTWRGFPAPAALGREDKEIAIHRLELLSSGRNHPIMHLGLDGLDEEISHEQKLQIRAIVQWFREKAQLSAPNLPHVLVVTCREREDFEKILSINLDGFTADSTGITFLDVPDFSPPELSAVAAMKALESFPRIDSSLRNRYPKEFRGPQQDTPERAILTVEPANPGDPMVVDSLLHPVMWRAFQELPPDERLLALDRDLDAIRGMLLVFVSWFCRKTQRRKPLRDVDSTALNETLRAIAEHTHAQEPTKYLPFSKWSTPAMQCSGAGGQVQARQMFNEARISGVILVQGQSWRWRHHLVCAYLAGKLGGAESQ